MGGPGAPRHRPSSPGRRLEGGGSLEGGTRAERSPGSGAAHDVTGSLAPWVLSQSRRRNQGRQPAAELTTKRA